MDRFSPFELLLQKWDPKSMDILLCLKNKSDFIGYRGNGDFNIKNEAIDCSLISDVFSSMKFVFTPGFATLATSSKAPAAITPANFVFSNASL